jgi:hypothetical protein
VTVQASEGLRPFLSRMLGWSDDLAVDLALRSLTLALEHRATLMLLGDGDLVPIAWALHSRTLGPDSPFIVCDPRRGTRAASVRSPTSRASGISAFEAAAGGSLCLRVRRLPDDLQAVIARLRCTENVLCVLCGDGQLANQHPPFILPAPLTVPSLAQRSAELDRIISEYAVDAIAQVAAPASSFTADDHGWVRDNAASSLAEIEKGTVRLVTLRTSRNLSHAAERLEMAPVSLSRWLGRRVLPPRIPSGRR